MRKEVAESGKRVCCLRRNALLPRTPPSTTHLMADLEPIPATLTAWRASRRSSHNPVLAPRPRWTPLEPFFASKGYTLFGRSDEYSVCIYPKECYPGSTGNRSDDFVDSPRKPDAFHQNRPSIGKGNASQFSPLVVRASW